jgi:hypothetical protein
MAKYQFSERTGHFLRKLFIKADIYSVKLNPELVHYLVDYIYCFSEPLVRSPIYHCGHFSLCNTDQYL